MPEEIDNETGEVKSAPTKLKFSVKNHVTLPLFKLGTEPRYLRFEAPHYVGKVVDDKKEPPILCRVTDMETEQPGEVILGAVMANKDSERPGILDEKYPNDSYVGKTFQITKLAPEGARKYSIYQVTEIEIEPAEQSAQHKGGKKAA
jgi:hypothetical protein